MSRSTRPRKVKQQQENVEEPKKKNLRGPVMKKSRDKNIKEGEGNEILSKNNDNCLSSLRSPVLRDRTNLRTEPTKIVDVLIKGDQKEMTKKTMEARSSSRTLRNSKKGAENQGNILAKRKRSVSTSEKKSLSEKTKKTRSSSVSVKKVNEDVAENEKKVNSDRKEIIKDSRLSRNTQKSTKESVSTEKVENTNDKKLKRSARKISKTDKESKILGAKQKSDDTLKENEALTKLSRNSRQKIRSEKKSDCESIQEDKEKNGEKSDDTEKISGSSPKQIPKRSSKRFTLKVADKSVSKQSVKKFFVTKGKKRSPTVSDSKISQMKRPIGLPKKNIASKKKVAKVSLSPKLRLRQTSLQESFSKAKRTLRTRKNLKNYHDESTILEKKKSPEKLKVKGPVYKTMNFVEEKPADEKQIYEFDFDKNDSNERIKKIKKKRVARKAPVKKNKATATTVKVPMKKNDIKNIKINPVANKAVVDNGIKINFPESSQNNIEKVKDPIKIPAQIKNTENVPSRIEVVAEVYNVPMDVDEGNDDGHFPFPPSPLLNDDDKQKRAAMQLQMDEKSLTTTPVQTKPRAQDPHPFRMTNIFKNRPSEQIKAMMNHSLIRRSLSPIKKQNEEFDDGSPWRPVPITRAPFSRVKNVIQSTPKGKQFNTIRGKTSPNKVNKKSSVMLNNIVEQNDENGNCSVIKEKSPKNNQINNSSKSPRKFGTEISNINESSVNISVPNSPENNSITIVNSRESRLVAPENENIISATNVQEFDENSENKENQVIISPRESPKKRNRLLLDSPRRSPNKLSDKKYSKSPVKPPSKAIDFEPQPGPSGTQKRIPLMEARLKQSNLNNFLNLTEMPESTRITTAHGIFDDPDSTPINGKPVKKVIKEMNVENAFGFADDDLDDSPDEIILSPLKIREKIVKEPYAKPKIVSVERPTRLIVGETKENPVVEANPQKREIDKIEAIRNHFKSISKKVVEAKTFEDTFDCISQPQEQLETAEVPLFVDLEPVHFKQPPRYSYKRKRAVAFNISDETEDEDDDDHEDDDDDEQENKKKKKRNKSKKRKLGKAAREQQKQIEEWAKSLNQTFEEVEQFDLVVE